MALVDRNASGIQLGNALAIDVGAEDLVPGFRKAGAGNQANVSTANDAKAQEQSPSGRAGPVVIVNEMPRGKQRPAAIGAVEG